MARPARPLAVASLLAALASGCGSILGVDFGDAHPRGNGDGDGADAAPVALECGATATRCAEGCCFQDGATLAPVDAFGQRIAVGFASCAVTANQHVACWGQVLSGIFGEKLPTSDPVLSPRLVKGVDGVVDIDGGDSYYCARRGDGEVRCWGRIGTGETPALPDETVRPVVGLGKVEKMSAGGGHACAIRPDRHLVCWGYNGNYEHGLDHRDAAGPTVVPDIDDVYDVTAGDYFTCAIHGLNREVTCWGSDMNMRIGAKHKVEGDKVTLPTLRGAKSISAGAAHACAIDGNDAVWCWGAAKRGELGNAAAVSAGTEGKGPVRVTGATGADWLALGVDHSCAHMIDGRMLCWGSLGSQWLVGSDTAALLDPGLENVAWAAGRDARCFMSLAGALRCQGPRLLGNGTKDGSSAFVDVKLPD